MILSDADGLRKIVTALDFSLTNPCHKLPHCTARGYGTEHRLVSRHKPELLEYEEIKVSLEREGMMLERRSSIGYAALTLAGVAMLVIAACSTTQQAPTPTTTEQQTAMESGFLGNYSLLSPGAEGQANLRYVNPSVNWSQYTKIMLQPVTFWDSDQSSVSPSDQQTLCNYFFNALQTALSKNFTLVEEPGPGVMTLAVAITNADAATPGLRTISTIVPQARVLNTAKYLATGTYAFVGSATAEAKITDSVSGAILAEFVDKRFGGGSLKAAAQWQWGDAENAMDAWAAQADTKLSEWQAKGAPAATPPAGSSS